MSDEYLKVVANNLLFRYQNYKDNMKELEDFERLLDAMHTTSKLRDGFENKDDHEKAAILDNILLDARTKLADLLNNNRDFNDPLEADFELWVLQFEESVRAVDAKAFPPSRRSSRASKFIPESIQRTSKRLSDRVILAMVKGTRYQDFASFSGIKNRHTKRLAFIIISWLVAVLGMITSIGFLTSDFVAAQKNLAVEVDRSPSSSMRLPAITICSDHRNIPTFVNYPTDEYPGLPLFVVSLYYSSNRSNSQASRWSYPETIPSNPRSPVEAVIVSNEADSSVCEKVGFDVNREIEARLEISTSGSFAALTNSGDGCLYCFRIGVRQEEVLAPFDVEMSAAMFSPAIHVSVTKSRLFGYCESNLLQRSFYIEQLLSSELELYAEELERRNILDFNGANYSVLLTTLKELRVEDHADFYCNVYFFSGFFYPSLDNASISYRFTGDANVWEKTGAGPYYSAYSWSQKDPLITGPDRESISKDSYTFGGIKLYAEDATSLNRSKFVSPETAFTVLDRSMVSTMYTFKKMLVMGAVQYKVTEKVNDVLTTAIRVVDTFHLGFDFELFELERVYTYSTMTWSEFVTDVLEFVGLFTGICIFTLIVAPANRAKEEVYKKK